MLGQTLPSNAVEQMKEWIQRIGYKVSAHVVIDIKPQT
jgi:hypothetical protein